MCCVKAKPRWPGQVRAGLDLGSRVAKLVVAGPDGIIKQKLMDSVPLLIQLTNNGSLPYSRLGFSEDIPLVITGYGKAALPGTPGISEIRAHFRGALAQTGFKDFTLVELGGQDSKVVQVEGGKALDFLTNDRCAAGTGRYLENMARLLGVELGELALTRQNPVEITNTCAIFGETEILSHIVEGRMASEIMAGINWSVARRIAQMVRRYRPKLLVFCGGVAFNQAVVHLTEQEAGCPVFLPDYPQLNGAIGCIMEEELL
jgi:predicted CoA-substrate-specific enzyme activase